MALMIKYKAKCIGCGKTFQKGQAFLTRVKGFWLCQCRECLSIKRIKEKIKYEN